MHTHIIKTSGCHHFIKIQEPHQNSACQKGDMEYDPYCVPADTRRYCSKLGARDVWILKQTQIWSQCSVVSRYSNQATDQTTEKSWFVSRQEQNISFARRSERLYIPQWVTGTVCLRVKWPGNEADHWMQYANHNVLLTPRLHPPTIDNIVSACRKSAKILPKGWKYIGTYR